MMYHHPPDNFSSDVEFTRYHIYRIFMKEPSRSLYIDPIFLILLFAGIVSVYIAGTHDEIDSQLRLTQVTPWWILATVLFGILIVYRERTQGVQIQVGGWSLPRLKIALIGLSIICIVWVLLLIIDKETTVKLHYVDVFLLWLAAIGLLIAAFAHRPQFGVKQFMRAHRTDLIAMAAFALGAAVLRLIALETQPDVIGGDEAVFGMGGLAVIDGAYENPFGTFHGAGTLFIHEIGALLRIFGVNVFGLRIVSAIGGTLAVPMVYLLGRELSTRRVAAIAATMMMVSHFHVHFSRMAAVTYIQGTFYSALTVYLLISGLRRESVMRLVLAGIVGAVYLMIYLDSRIMLGVIVVALAGLFIVERPLIKRNGRRLLVVLMVFLIVAAPILLWAVRHPDEFSARFAAAGTFGSGLLETRAEETGRGSVGLIADSLIATFLTIVSGPLFEFYFFDAPILPAVSGILFLFGLIYALLHLRRTPMLILNIWFWGGISAISIFTLDLFSAGYRLLFVFPPICIFIGIGLDRLLDMLHLPKQVAIRATVVVAVLISTINLYAYFISYLPSCEFGGDEVTRLSSRLGAYLGTLHPDTVAYLLTDESLEAGTHPSLDFLSGSKTVENVYLPLSEVRFEVEGPIAFVAVWSRRSDLDTMIATFPGGRKDLIFDCGIQAQLVSYYVTIPERSGLNHTVTTN